MDNKNFSLEELFNQMKSNAKNLSVEESYTAYLASLESEKVTKKFMEEAYELSLAAVERQRYNKEKSDIINEASDVIYHLLAVLVNREVEFDEVMAELERRSKNKKKYK